MEFDRRPTNSTNTTNNNVRRRLKTTYTNKIIDKKFKNKYLKILIILSISFVVLFILGCIFLYFKYIVGLPDVRNLENLEISESSTIYDRDGNELYKIFKEKRTYVSFENINKNMVNAIVSIEDKRYWTNPGVDILGLFRAGINYIFGSADEVKGTSTLTQQLIRNTIIKNEKSIARKVKEIYLAYKLTSNVSKEKILELYLNKIEYGHNAFGIEEAAKTFFNKSSKDLGILESSILASLPKGPTYYSPYNHPDRLVGFPYIYTNGNEEEPTKIISSKDVEDNKEAVSVFTDFIKNIKASRIEATDKILLCNLDKKYFKISLQIDNDGCGIVTYPDLITFLNGIKIELSKDNYIEYETGRKDRVLGRMLEDEYIDFDQYKEAFLNSIGMTFNQKAENIKAPHFVFFVKEYLEEKFGQDIVSIGGLKIYTSLDSKLQAKAEELVNKQVGINTSKFDASNAALISIDNETGQILSMIGGRDYFDSENKGNVNIITSKLQPGSSFKPFVFLLGMINNAIGTHTPIYDLQTNFPSGYTPSNFDGKFMGKIDISKALDYSRNVTAIKMFFMAGGETKIIEFMKKFGVTSLKDDGMYGAPLALGTGEMTPLELARAYSVLANKGIKREITPILRIEDSKGNIIEDNSIPKNDEQAITESQAYIITSILSDKSSRPSNRNSFLSLKNRVAAAKTGTSTKQYTINGKKSIYPSNLWAAGYTPQITTVVWAGNTDGKQLNYSGNGLEGAAPIWRDFMEYAHSGKSAETWTKPSGVYEISISEISGLLPSSDTNESVGIISSLFLNKPEKYDNSYKTVEVDALCNGLVGENTPEAAIKKATLLQLNSLNPNNPSWQNPVNQWAKSEAFTQRYGNIPNLITTMIDEECDRSGDNTQITINSSINNGDTLSAGENYIELSYSSKNPLVKIDIMIGDTIIDEINIDNKTEGTYDSNVFIPVSKAGKKTTITFKAVDNQYYSNYDEKEVLIVKSGDISNTSSTTTINLINPIDGSIKLYNTDFFNLKANVAGTTPIKSISILLDGTPIASGLTDRNIAFGINENKDIEVGTHIITIEAIDSNGNSTQEKVQLEVLQR